MEDGKPPLRIGPDAGELPKASGRSQPRETFHGVFIGIFRGDLFAVGETEFPATDMHRLFRFANEVHLDAALPLVVNRLVPPKWKIEIRAQFAICPDQEVEIELSRDARNCRCRRLRELRDFSGDRPR